MFHQNDYDAPIDFQHVACLFSATIISRELLGGTPWTLKEAVATWIAARDAGIISGDRNKDGDYDDDGEDEIQSFERLVKFAKLPLRVVAPGINGFKTGLDRNGVLRIMPTDTPIDPARYWVIEAWRWKITHFVVGDGTGRRPVRYDSIVPGSLTVKNGKCESLRVFEIIHENA